MIKKRLYKEIASKWEGKIYQNYERLKVRIPYLMKYSDIIKGKKVLEIGSNAGMFAWHLSQVAKSYIGVERMQEYYNQSLITEHYIENPNVTFYHMDFDAFVKSGLFEKCDYDTFFTSYVLYHFTDDEIEQLKEKVLKKCNTAIIMNRRAKRDKEGMRDYNSYTLWRAESVLELLTGEGYRCDLHWHPKKKFHLVIGTK